MINHHISAAMATERRNALLAEAEAARRAKQARLHRQRTRTSGARRSPLRWVLDLVAVRPDPSVLAAAQPSVFEDHGRRRAWVSATLRTLNDARGSAAQRALRDPLAAQTSTMASSAVTSCAPR